MKKIVSFACILVCAPSFAFFAPHGRFGAQFSLNDGLPRVGLTMDGKRVADVSLGVELDVPLQPLGPFFERVLVRPAPGGLTAIRAKTPHPKGLVETDLRFDGRGGVVGSVTLPAGVTGVFAWKDVRTDLVSGANAISQSATKGMK